MFKKIATTVETVEERISLNDMFWYFRDRFSGGVLYLTTNSEDMPEDTTHAFIIEEDELEDDNKRLIRNYRPGGFNL